MVDSSMERMRQFYEDLDTLESGLAEVAGMQTKTKRQAITNEHIVHDGLKKMQQVANQILVAHKDADGLRREELALLTGPDMMDEYYSRIEKTMEHYERHPGQLEQQNPLDLLQPSVKFSGEEVYGKCLDLTAQHTQWLNVLEEIAAEKPSYLVYLRTFQQARSSAPVSDADGGESNKASLLQSKPYKNYIRALAEYLVGFHRRIQPLVSVSHLLKREAEQHAQDTRQTVTSSSAAAASGGDSGLLDLGSLPDVAATAALGADNLKAQLSLRGLKCGGTLQQRAERLWAVRGVGAADIPTKLRAKNFDAAQAALAAAAEQGEAEQTSEHDSDDEDDEGGKPSQEQAQDADGTDVFAAVEAEQAAVPHESSFSAGTAATMWHERVVRFMCGTLSDVVSATISRAQRRQTRTWEELQADKEAEAQLESQGGSMVGQGAAGAAAADSDSDDEDGPIYNPKKVPLDWDGKPIPYWLYKLHGLRFSFPCEVCGGVTYQGPKVFQEHFSRAEHAAGMRRLGIPNSAHFHGLSKIADVQALWGKVRTELEQKTWNADTQEEFEDSAGNVMNRRTYEDLARQGLL